MKPLPNINDVQAMLERGRRSALFAARTDATEALRDALVAVQSCDWDGLEAEAEKAREAAGRLLVLAGLWSEHA